ncbi:MAG TPA: hypothetical protein VGP04_19895 [Pseudonocardiaceae bacterium]|nr:hypothetical protein [Pseudonocardiaceae bacterium]
MARTALDASGRTVQTSIPGSSDLSGFDLEPYGEVVSRMAGGSETHSGRRSPVQLWTSLTI